MFGGTLNIIGGAAAAWLAVAVPAFAQTEMPAPSPADDKYVAPRVSQAYRDALAKLPDWTGFWVGDRVNGLGYCADCQHFYLADDPAPDDAVGRLPSFPAGSKNLGIPYNATGQKMYDDLIEKGLRGGDTDPDSCLRPHTTPDAMSTGFAINGGMEIIMTPGEVRLVFDWMNGTRHIYTDGRPHPTPDGLTQTYMGHSIGHWEGDTLVVDTIAMLPGFYDQTAAPYSDQIHLTERMRLIADGRLENQMVFEDPVMLKAPFKTRRTYSKTEQPKDAVYGNYCWDARDSNTAVPASLIK